MSFVYEFSKLMNISKKSFIRTMQSFKGLPHRFEIFMKKKGITFIDDSKATTFTATSSAISSLKNIFWILGGLPKKGDKIRLSNYKKNIIKCYLIGKIIFSTSKNLKKAIIQIFKDYKSIKIKKCVILLSPAAASFDQFDNFKMRGLEFKRLSKFYARKLL